MNIQPEFLSHLFICQLTFLSGKTCEENKRQVKENDRIYFQQRTVK